MDNFEKYMTPPEEPKHRAYLQDGWLHCPYCGKKIFPVKEDTIIWNLEWICKNSKCKKIVSIDIDRFIRIDRCFSFGVKLKDDCIIKIVQKEMKNET